MNKNYLFNNYINQGKRYKQEGNLLKALRYFNKAFDTSLGRYDIDLLIDIALLYDEIGLEDKALEMYEKVLNIDKSNASALYGMAIIYDNKENVSKAREYYKMAIEADPFYEKAYYYLGIIEDDLGNVEEAINLYNKAIELDPYEVWAYGNIGCIYERTNQDKKALMYFNKALEIEEDYRIYYNIGVSLKKLGYIEEAKKNYLKSIELEPSFPSSYLNLAVIYKESFDYSKGIFYLSEGIKNNLDVSYLYYNRGCMYVLNNEYENAIKDIKKSIELDDFFIDYSKKDTELKPIINKVFFDK